VANLTQLFEQFLQDGLYLKGWSPKTPVIYKRAFASLQDSLRGSDYTFRTLTKASLQAWVVAMRQKDLSLSCCNIYMRAVSSFCSWLHDEGHMPERLKLRQLPNPRKPIRTFADAEVRLGVGASTYAHGQASEAYTDLPSSGHGHRQGARVSCRPHRNNCRNELPI